MREEYIVQSKEQGLKVIDVLVQRFRLSSRQLRKAKRDKLVLVNNRRISFGAYVSVGDKIELILPDEENIFEPVPLKINVLYEDDYVLAVEKPPFLVVHPTKSHQTGTLGNALAYHMIEKGDNYKIRFINRLDRDTSGIVLVAKNALAQQRITDQMKENLVYKKYKAVVVGKTEEAGELNFPIGHDTDDEVKRAVVADGKAAKTRYQLERYVGDCSLVDIELITGRTHQIRVHFAHIGHAVLGDGLYGEASPYIKRQALHCIEMSFLSPFTNERIHVFSELAEDINEALLMLSNFSL